MVAGEDHTDMRTPTEAIAEILEHTRALNEEESASLEESVGRVLARDVHSDLDLPPFEKSAMDGFAVRSRDFEGGSARLAVLGESRAGEPFAGPVPPGACVAIYTGAELPESCDSVVMVERSRRDGDFVVLEDEPAPAQHVCHRGEDLGVGELVKPRGHRIRHIDLAPLASVGCDPAPVVRRPRVSIFTTGDELCAPSETPGRGQIRESNTMHLATLGRRAGAEARNLGVLPDDAAALRQAFAGVLETSDVVVTTGGVSMGEYDLVGRAFEEAGVECVFHKVSIKPGKPLWFGKRGDVLVFGLPGNPVSCLVGHDVFVRPALAKLSGALEEEWSSPNVALGRWRGEEPRAIPRQQNIPVTLRQAADGVVELEPVRWKGSGDVVGLSRAEGLAICPAGETLRSGALVSYRPL